MTSMQCNRYDSCSAPLCPLDSQSLEGGIWYPGGEEICSSQAHRSLPWIRAQRKIAKVESDPSRYFTFAMLNRGCVIRRGITGLDPDQPEELQLRRWMQGHPPARKKELSEKQKSALMEGRKKQAVR